MGRLPARGSDDDDEDDGEDEGGNEYYVGGNSAESGGGSGLSVVAPSAGRGGGGPANAMEAMRRAMELAQRQRGGPPAAAAAQGQPGGKRIVRVTIYRNGFTVNDGPLRKPGVPENDAFAEALASGYCPDELVENGRPADVQLENKEGEDFRESARPAAAAPAFQGEGMRVGEIALSAGPVITAGTEAAGMLVVNEPEASIRVQVRFPNGSREVFKFEKHHTVRHLIHRIETGRSLTRYQIMSSERGNPKPMDPSQFDLTLTDAGLAGSVVTVREVS